MERDQRKTKWAKLPGTVAVGDLGRARHAAVAEVAGVAAEEAAAADAVAEGLEGREQRRHLTPRPLRRSPAYSTPPESISAVRFVSCC